VARQQGQVQDEDVAGDVEQQRPVAPHGAREALQDDLAALVQFDAGQMADDGVGGQQEGQHQDAQRPVVEHAGQQPTTHQQPRGGIEEPGHLPLAVPSAAGGGADGRHPLARCPAPPSPPAARFNIRRMERRHTASNVSNSGTPTASMGTPRPAMNDAFECVEIDSAAKVNPKEQAAGVAEKHIGGMEVVAQEAEARPREPHEQQHVARRAAEHQRKADAAGRDQRDAGGEPVHAVDQVERIHQRDEPEHGGR
jgi:hypothetical protein